MKNNKAVTLVALIITIIILLILAGVSIQAIISDNGLFNKAKQAEQTYIESEIKENLTLAISDLLLEKEGKATMNDITQDWADNKLNEYNPKVNNKNNGETQEKTIILTKGGATKKYKIKADLSIEEMDLSGIIISTPTVNTSNDTTVTTSVAENSTERGTPLYINFRVSIDEEMSYKIKYYDKEITMPYQISINGKYKFTIEGKLGDNTTTKIVEIVVNQYKGNHLIPIMTDGNTKDGVTVSVSDYRDAVGAYSACEEYKAVDNDINSAWLTDSGNYETHWFLIEFSKPKIVKKYKLIGMVSYKEAYTFCLQASNDNENWVDLEDEIHQPGVSYSARTFEYEINNENEYKYYRIYIPTGGWTNGTSGAAAIYELELYGE